MTSTPHSADSGMGELENFRLETLAKNKRLNKLGLLVFLGMFVTIIILSAFATFELVGTFFFILFLGAIFAGILFYKKSKNKKAYRTMFRSKVVGQMWNQIDPEINFTPDQCISRFFFDASQLFRVTPNSYKGENYISKTYPGFILHASELDVTKRGSGKNNNSVPVFNGVFIVFELPFAFEGATVIVKDLSQGVLGFLGGFLQNLGHMKYDLMEFNNPEFEKYFQIYSTNRAQTMKLVENDVVIQLLATRLNNGPLQMSFVDRFICIAIEDRSTFFMADPKVSLTDEASLRTYLNELKKYETYYSRFIPIVERIANPQ